MNDKADRPSPWLGAVLILVLLGALAWKASEPHGAEAASDARPAAQQGAAPSLGNVLGEAPQAAPLAPLHSEPPLASDEIELCGAGRVKVDASGQPMDKGLVAAAALQARQRLQRALAEHPSELARAAALLISGGEPSTGARDGLADMALSTRAPQVYALAMRACRTAMQDGKCRMLSPEQWAHLDPNNAIPWLYVAAAAQARGDAAAQDDALFHVAAASSSDSRLGLLPSFAASHVAGASWPGAGWLMLELMGQDAAEVPPYVMASRHCSVEAVTDVNRQQECARMAEMLATRGKTLVDLGLGAAIGQRVGWPAARVDALRQERDALLEISRTQFPARLDVWTCAAQQEITRYVDELGRSGELAALRRALQASGASAESLAAAHAASVAAQAASAASGASALVIPAQAGSQGVPPMPPAGFPPARE